MIGYKNKTGVERIYDINRNGKGVKFVGSNDYITIPTNSDIGIANAESKTFALVLNVLSIPSGNNTINSLGGLSRGSIILSNRQTSAAYTGYDIAINISGSGYGLRILKVDTVGGTGTIYTNTALSFNTVYHIVAQFDSFNASNWKIYINGVLVATTVQVNSIITGRNTNSTYPLLFGNLAADDLSYDFNGIIWSARMFNRNLTQLEITKLYTTSNRLLPTSAVSAVIEHWDFEASSGTTLTGDNGNNGTLTGMTTGLGSTNQHVDCYSNAITS